MLLFCLKDINSIFNDVHDHLNKFTFKTNDLVMKITRKHNSDIGMVNGRREYFNSLVNCLLKIKPVLLVGGVIEVSKVIDGL